jgi:hypothetical protein
VRGASSLISNLTLPWELLQHPWLEGVACWESAIPLEFVSLASASASSVLLAQTTPDSRLEGTEPEPARRRRQGRTRSPNRPNWRSIGIEAHRVIGIAYRYEVDVSSRQARNPKSLAGTCPKWRGMDRV